MAAFLLHFVLPFVVIVSVLVFSHEFGHYTAARLVGVAVDRFSVGFGPGIVIARDRRGTEWRIGIVPLGGYVKLRDEKGGVADKGAKGFASASTGEKAAILLAGPGANAALALALMLAHFTISDIFMSPPVVSRIAPGGPAAAAGLSPGDEIVSLNGSRIDDFNDVTRHAALHLGEPLSLEVRRHDVARTVVVHPRVAEVEVFGNRREQIGLIDAVGPPPRVVELDLWERAAAAIAATRGLVGDVLLGLRQIVLGERALVSVAGVVGIAQMIGTVFEQAGWQALIPFSALLSINLAVVNLLPLPALDGGQLALLLAERCRRNPMPASVHKAVNAVGLGVVVAILVLTTVNDLSFLG